jgi:hypothetical protein
VVGAYGSATVRYPDHNDIPNGQPTGDDGIAVLVFVVGAVPPGQLVVIDAAAYLAPHAYPTRVVFLSQAIPTRTLAPTLSPTWTPSPTATNTPTNTPTP